MFIFGCRPSGKVGMEVQIKIKHMKSITADKIDPVVVV